MLRTPISLNKGHLRVLNRRILLFWNKYSIFFAADCLAAYSHFYKTVTAMYSTKNSFLPHNSMPCGDATPVYASGSEAFTSAFSSVFHVIIPSVVGKQAGLHDS
jgi:hypothetical protein